MRDVSHKTWIAIVLDHVNAWRKANGWSRETVVQMIVEAHDRMNGQVVTGIKFEPHTADTFERWKVNADRVFRWLDDSSKERRVDKRKIRELRHAAGVRYFDFTPVLIVALASVVGARYLAIGTGDTELYIFAGMLAAVVISIRVFLFRGAGKAN